MRLNVRFSALGVPEDYKGFLAFPYVATSVVTGKQITFESLADVKKEMTNIMAQNEQAENSNVGRVLYEGLPFFANSSNFVDKESQLLISKFQYCQLTNTPPYRSLDDTPAMLIDSFTVIDNEINAIKKEAKMESRNNGS